MTGIAIRVAFICAARTQAEIANEKLNIFGAFTFVHFGKDLKTNFKEMVKSSPQVIIIDTSSDINYYNNFDPRFSKIRNNLPSTKILIRTELRKDHPFIQEAYKNGASIIDECLDYQKIAETIGILINTNEQIVRYESRIRDLEPSANPSHYQKRKSKFRDHRDLRPIREKE
ncbi:MAG: hypothetical protein Q7K55_01730 [Candidatus Levybacteria bacterium]|nr:hypothetical protein [Candidatus Levybacteria bacterium]